jgi:iron complex outermembrane receptor protein
MPLRGHAALYEHNNAAQIVVAKRIRCHQVFHALTGVCPASTAATIHAPQRSHIVRRFATLPHETPSCYDYHASAMHAAVAVCTESINRGSFMSFPIRTSVLAVIAAGCGSLSVLSAIAQTPVPAQKIEKIEVTGSNIKRVDTEGVAAVQVITREEIERSGKSSVAEVIRNISSNSGNSLNEVFTNSFSPGASGVSLRGLGQKNTLVLINGRRMANYGFAQNLQDTYVDLNSIPTGAVERIEVLKDGASAVYGSDAIGGVVNIILRRDYKGGEIGLSGGTSTEGGLNEMRANLAAGMGDLGRDKFNLLGTLDYFKRDLLLASERDWTKNQDTRAYPGGALNWASIATYRRTPRVPFSSCGVNNPGMLVPGAQLNSTGTLCAYNPAELITLFPKSERLALLGRGTVDLNADTSAFAELSFSHNKTFQKATPTPLSPTSVAYNPTTGGVTVVSGTLPASNGSNPFGVPVGINYGFFDVGPRNTDIDSKSYRAVAGLKGVVSGWDWEAGAGNAQNKVEQINYNRVDRYILTQAIANNTYNFLNPSAGSVTATQLRINPVRKSTSKLDFVDAKISSEIGSLPAGPVGFAAGIEHRRESIQDVPDRLITGGNVLGQGATGTDGKRNNTAGYVELSVPAAKSLEFQLAGRQDKYSDFGSAFSPKIGMKWAPDKTLLVRATVSRGFRAPTLPENSRSSATFFTSVVDTLPTSPNFNQNVSIAGSFAGNPALKAERSRNSNVGFVWEPDRDFNLGVTWYKIRQNDVVNANGFQTIVNNPAQFPGQILRAADGTLVAINDAYRNLAFTETSGLDIDVKKSFKFESGKLTLSADYVYIDKFKSQPAQGQDIVDYVDSNGFNGGGIPRYRGRVSGTWERSGWVWTLSRYQNASWDQQQVAVPPAQARVGAYAQYDLYVAYDGLRNWRFFGSVQNLADTKPPFDPQNGGTASTVQYDISQNDLRGRYVTVGARYTFK